MVKTTLNQKEQNPSSSSFKYKGVRKRKWGKYVSEIRLPNSRERIWLGSHDTAEKAARAFDAALFCLRGPNAKFNFPDNPPNIANGRSMTPAEIQIAAACFARSGPSGRVDNSDYRSDSLLSSSSSELIQHVDSPCPSVSGGAGQVESEFTEMPLDNGFLDQFLNFGTDSNNNVPDFGLFPGFDDFSGDYFVPPFPTTLDYWQDNTNSEELTSQGSFLWNF
ncbi:hypothetical protein RD792_010908 [Penstemon davidsonii]|uniref:AP2/ERF domain-containing protein n=1 Tax=Penstemon davidsonii TaxID=160366 RepID=A0ABR0D341_9LAMI|nr:hypothetical protein RD792_010908 [Penstemon davidsonii]